MGPRAPERVTQPLTVGARLQRRPRRAATAASPPRTINATSSTHPRMAVLPRAPRGQTSRERSLLWMVHVEAGPLRVPPAFGQCQRGAGEPR